MNLKINEIYHSIQGESSFAGLPCVFIRTTGCSLRCRWCDTDYAFQGGEVRSIASILDEVKNYHCQLVELTGGEPLDQKGSIDLLKALCDTGYTVLMETGGHLSLENVDSRVHCIMDVKCPSSKMSKLNRLENLKRITKKDEVKFVIADRNDYEWAIQKVDEYHLSEVSNPIFSPVYEELSPMVLAQWILEDQKPIRFQIQQHKYIWGKDTKGV